MPKRRVRIRPLSNELIEQQKIWLMLMLSQASLAVKALREAGIPCLMLKGGAGLLAGWLKVERRPVTDIDLLIPPGRLEEAARILTAKGWSPAFRPYLPCDARRHSHPVSSPEGGLLVDIHWFSLRHARWPGVDDVLWQGAWRAKLFDGDVLIPSPEDFLVHTVAHGRRAGSPGSLWREDVRTLLEHPSLSVDWDRVERTAQNYRVAPMVAAALEEVRAEAPDCVSEEICRRLRRLPAPLSDRFFLQLVRRFPEEIGFGHAVIVGLDFFRTRPCSFREPPWAFVKYLKDRWELSSPRQVPVRFVEVILWGLQVELGKFFKRLRGTSVSFEETRRGNLAVPRENRTRFILSFAERGSSDPDRNLQLREKPRQAAGRARNLGKTNSPLGFAEKAHVRHGPCRRHRSDLLRRQ